MLFLQHEESLTALATHIISKRLSSPENRAIFWDCLSKAEWPPHHKVDNETKQNPHSACAFICRTSWEFCQKDKCDSLVNQWHMYFQATDWKGHQFLELTDNDGRIIEPSYYKGRAWLTHFANSPSLCACATLMITNHAPTGVYRRRFFPN